MSGLRTREELTVGTAAFHAVYNKEQNLRNYMRFIDQAAAQGVELLVFPECSLQGYLYHLNHALTEDEFAYHYENAEPIPGPATDQIAAKAREHNMVIVFGMVEDPGIAGHTSLYNCAVAVGPEGVIGVYRKVHAPGDEFHVFRQGDSWPVFDTPVGRIGMLICYDKMFPEAGRELALQGAEFLIMPTAWPLMGNQTEGDHSFFLYNLYDAVRAAENQAFFISSNQQGICELTGRHFFGHSRIMDPTGRTLAEVGDEEGLAVARVNVRQRLLAARTWDVFTHNLLKDRRPDTYCHIADTNLYNPRPWLRKSPAAAQGVQEG